ncbi:lipopolysaccharide biosynthesis protein [Spirochaetota bacterium]
MKKINTISNILHKTRKNPFFNTLVHTSNYFTASIMIRAMGFISLPVMTRILSPKDFGIDKVVVSYLGILSTIISLNTYVALGRYYYEKKDDFKDFFGTSLIINFFLFITAWIVTICFKGITSNFLGLPANTIIFIVPQTVFLIFNSWFEQIYIPQEKSKKIAVRNIISAYSVFGLSVLFILLMEKYKYMGPTYSRTVIGTAFIFYYMFELKKYFKLSFKIKHLKYIISYSFPLIPYSLSGIILVQFDRIIINKIIGPTEAGLYSFAYTIGMLLTIVVGALHRAWMPKYYRYMGNKEFDKIDNDISKMFRIISVISLFLIFFGKEMGMLLAKKNFHSSLPLVPIIVISYIFNAIFAFYGWNNSYVKKTIYLSITVLISGILNIVLNVVFIPRYGYFIAAYTTLASYFVMALLIWIINKFYLKIYCTPVLKILNPIFALIPLIIIYYIITFYIHTIWFAVLLKVFLLGLFFLFIFNKFIFNTVLNNKKSC